MKMIRVRTTALLFCLAFFGNTSAATGFLKGESGSGGMSKVCFYDVLGETYTLNVSSVSLCPLSHNFNVAPRPTQQIDNSRFGKTGFLKGEQPSQGLSKICIYDVLGDTQMITVSSASLCPLNYRF